MIGPGISGKRTALWRVAFGCLFCGACIVWILIEENDPVPVGVPFPLVVVRNGEASFSSGRDTLQKELLILFRWHCPHCRHQLDILDDHIKELQGARLALLSVGSAQGIDSLRGAWKHLFSAPNVVVGILEDSLAREMFGRPRLPLLLFIDRRGILRERISGFTAIRTIVSVIERI